MEHNKLVFIILLNYKGYKDTTDCIKSLKKINYKHYKIIVVDNQSCDGSFERIIKENPDVITLLAPSNNGFSAGNNIGIRYALENGADYVLLLNNDTVVDRDFLDIMMCHADDNTAVTPSIYYYSYPQEIWYAAGYINYNRCTVGNRDDKESKYVDYASGCCVLLSSKLIKKIGLWAEEYFMYYEDMDYSLRIIRSGMRIYYANKAVVYHKVGRTSGRGSRLNIYYNVRNRFYVINKYKFSKTCFLYAFFTRIVRGIHGLLLNTNDKVCFVAMFDYCKGIMYKNNRWL